MNLNVERYELKYFVNVLEKRALVNRLKHALKIDPYSRPHRGYFIRSLYFDSFDDECLHEKLAGVQFRKKYRLRIYDPASESVKLEVKHKHNNQIFKETAIITRQSADAIIAGCYEEMLTYKNPLLNQVYVTFKSKLYRPRVIVEYERDAFIFDHFSLRITTDSHLRSSNTCLDLFSKDLHAFPVVLGGRDILEIKFNSVFPEFLRNVIQLDSFERSAISKYALARGVMKRNQWEDV